MPPADLLLPGIDVPEDIDARADRLTQELVKFCRATRLPAVLPDTIEAGDAWGANCGPMALAAVLNLPTVEAARELVQPFRGFMSPTNMNDALELAMDRGLARASGQVFQRPPAADPWPALGLVRIQWLGPWCEPGVNPRAAYRFTHWLGAKVEQRGEAPPVVMVYDATPNRWLPLWAWERWCPTLWPRRATGWAPVTRIDVSLPTGPKGQVRCG